MSVHSPFSNAENKANQPATVGRRAALGYLGAAAGATTLALAGCTKDTETAPIGVNKSDVDFGTGDASRLNYLYALEQLTSAFYARVLTAPPNVTNFTFQNEEQDNFQRISQHKSIHRDLLKATLVSRTATNPIRILSLNFAGIDFTRRTTTSTTQLGVMQAAQMFADLGVAAYNGISISLQNLDFIPLIAKMVSVNARHAAYLRNRLYPDDVTRSFAGDNQVDALGLDKAIDPATVIATIQPYIINRLILS